MIIIIPLGGIGDRFKKNGYKYPKALINVLGKPILFWLLDSLILKKDTVIYIPYNKDYKTFADWKICLKKHIQIYHLISKCWKTIHEGLRKP